MPPKKQKDEDELDLKALLGLETPKKKSKRELSEDQKQVLRDRLVKMREVAKQKREEKKKNVSFEKDETSGENVIIKPKDNMDNRATTKANRETTTPYKGPMGLMG